MMQCAESSICCFRTINRNDGGLKITPRSIPLQKLRRSPCAHLRRSRRAGIPPPKKADFSAEAKAESTTPLSARRFAGDENRPEDPRAGRRTRLSKANTISAILPQAARQAGSAFKPFVYAAASRRGCCLERPSPTRQLRAERFEPRRTDA